MGLNDSIEGSNPSFSASATPRSRTPAEGWQSGRMRRSRKPLSVQADRRFKSSPLRSDRAENRLAKRFLGPIARLVVGSLSPPDAAGNRLKMALTGAQSHRRT